MSRHGHDGLWPGAGHARSGFPGRGVADLPRGGPPPRTRRPIAWTAAIVGLAVWSLLAWIGYAAVDGVLSWVAANAGVAVDSGKNLADAFGVGKQASAVAGSLDASGLLGQGITLLRAVAKPAIVVLWAIGALLIVGAPLLLSRIGGLLAASRR